MIVDTAYSNIQVELGGSSITTLVESIDFTRTNIIQAVISLADGHGLNPKPGQMITLRGFPLATDLVVQTYTSNRLTVGCYLAVYLQANPSEPSKPLSNSLGSAINAILKDRGVPPGNISVANSVKLGSVPTLGDNPVDMAQAAGYRLYSDSDSRVRLTPLMKPTVNIGTLDPQELSQTPEPGSTNPLSANTVVVEGQIAQVKDADVEYTVTSKTAVRGGFRETEKRYRVGNRKTIETETIKEPRSQVSTFSHNFESSSDPNDLLSKFSRTRKSGSVESQKTVVTTEVDRDNYLKRRTKVVEGLAARGLSQFFAAWASAEIPPPTSNEPETIEVSARDFAIAANAISQGNFDYSSIPDYTDPGALTIAKPRNMFRKIDLEFEEETWDWDLGGTQTVITNPNTSRVSFAKNRGQCKYERTRYLPVGAILPEMGNPVFGYQVVVAGNSTPRYRDGAQMVVAEKEVILYTQEESGDWIADRTLEQATGIRNAQEPIDAMRSVKLPPGDQGKVDRSNVAINVATQLTLAVNERLRSSPPGKLEISDTKQYTQVRDYKFSINIGSEDLLNRSVQISPSPFAPDISAIADAAKFQALVTRGEANQISLQLPLQGLTFDIPPNSVATYDGVKYVVNSLSASITSGQGVITLRLYPW